jgi:hypothetical protein
MVPCARSEAGGPALNAPEIAANLSIQTETGSDRLPPRRLSKDGAHDQHPPARDEMLQIVRQALDVFARLLLEAVHFADLGDQRVTG